MAPRGRPGKSKSRMETAINEMNKLGFPKKLVRSKLNNLLKEYGKEGFPFIEQDDYKVLIDAIYTPQEEAKQGEMKNSDEVTAVKHDPAEHEVNDVSISVSAGASEEGGTNTGYEMPNSAFHSDKDGGLGNTSAGSAQEGHGRSNQWQKAWWIKDGEEYKPPVIVYSPGKPIIPSELLELYRNYVKEDASGEASASK